MDLEQQLPSDCADCSDLCLGNKRGKGREWSQGRRDAANQEAAPALDKGGKHSQLFQGREGSEHQPTALTPLWHCLTTLRDFHVSTQAPSSPRTDTVNYAKTERSEGSQLCRKRGHSCLVLPAQDSGLGPGKGLRKVCTGRTESLLCQGSHTGWGPWSPCSATAATPPSICFSDKTIT